MRRMLIFSRTSNESPQLLHFNLEERPYATLNAAIKAMVDGEVDIISMALITLGEEERRRRQLTEAGGYRHKAWRDELPPGLRFT